MTFIPYGKQSLDDADIKSVVDVLKSDFLTQGPSVERFEKAICDYTGAQYCVAVSSATAALHIAVAALKLNSGCEGITSPITFVASSNSLIYNSVRPVFADISLETFNIDTASLREKISEKTKVLIPVHFAGRVCDMQEIYAIAKRYKLDVIEDAAHAIGSCYNDGSRVGNCRYSTMTVFSFHPVKTMTTGEGGAITTNDPTVYARLLMLRSHGITRDPSIISVKDAPWYYEMHELGFNYRMTDIQAALGVSQLKKVETFKQKRNEIVDRYNSAFSGLTWLRTPKEEGHSYCYHLYVLQVDFEKLGKSRQQVMADLRSKNIGSQVHYIPVHTQPYYKKCFAYSYGDYPNAEAYYNKTLSIPLYPNLSESDVNTIICAVKSLAS